MRPSSVSRHNPVLYVASDCKSLLSVYHRQVRCSRQIQLHFADAAAATAATAVSGTVAVPYNARLVSESLVKSQVKFASHSCCKVVVVVVVVVFIQSCVHKTK